MRKHVLSLSLAVCALASALIVAGCGNSTPAAPAATATPTTPPTATMPALPTANPALGPFFTSPDGGYAFQYPTGWTTQAYNTSPVVNGEFVISPDAKNYFLTLPLNLDASSQYASFFDQFLVGFGGTKIKVTAKGTAPVGANTWTVYEATFTKGGVAYDGVEFGLTHNGNSFLVIALAPHATSNAVGNKYFEPMLTSLTFLK